MLLTASLEAALHAEAGPACAVDLDGVIVFLNRGWDLNVVPQSEERATRRWLIGKRWTDSFSPVPAAFYRSLFEAALALPPEPGVALMHASECNTPTLIRRSLTWLAPVHQDGRPTGCLIVYGLQDVGAASAVYGASGEPFDAYLGSDGAVRQCHCCRRLARPGTGYWDFVPQALTPPRPRAQQVECGTCRELYWAPPEQVPSRWPR